MPISYLKLIGVCFASISSGFGEITFLAMTSFYTSNTVAAWSSGTGGAGVFGALSYLALTSWFGFSNFTTLNIITILPFFILFSSFVLLTGNHSKNGFCSRGGSKKVVVAAKPRTNTTTTDEECNEQAIAASENDDSSELTFRDRMRQLIVSSTTWE